ncbi:NADP-specific glutamate dehydrogenase [Flavobacterium sp. P4023]|uniref:Glutamate dehydrogenase n=1 Tax=Flavobacterium flabelliforme TaxID=2816119 RepID=A0ABS5CRS2_9FLAO|nr:NADP-specific glutamate dehydrogenase [Flavobacterium flabelliforme]MBP4141320.1 NADP-specific glutamate dehydrogenase [Flavobacterium flabelliforme]
MSQSISVFIEEVAKNNPNELEFMQAVLEVAEAVIPFIEKNKKYQNKMLLERMVEAERIVIFRVPWIDDNGRTQVNRGYRVQMNSAIGPYKGGIRFHPSVNLSILKFLAFEQTFKNSLTTLPMGGGKGGANFDPKGKSDIEVMRFCQSFMNELCRHIGPDTDVPAGDIGVGAREVGYMFGQYKKIKNEFTGVLTGKGMSFGGSLIRPQATGYGTVYFAQSMLATKGHNFKDKIVVISGSGNVAQYATEKVNELGGKVVALSDSLGYVYDQDGFDAEKLAYVMELKNELKGTLKDYVTKFPKAEYILGARPWDVKCDIALPCATQNELDDTDARILVANGCICVAEGANMPSTAAAMSVFQQAKILYAPGKASNAGGVATSGLEMSQNSLRLKWSFEKVEERLREIMTDIHQSCVKYGTDENGHVDYVKGANIAGFVKVADAMLAQGVV